MAYTLSLLDASLIIAGLYIIKRWVTRPPAPLPPGPKAWPIIGNFLDMPSSQEWLTFTKWAEKYGDIVSVSVMGQRIIILNSSEAAINLLDKKSSIYSGRPRLYMCQLCGWDNLVAMMQPHQERFKHIRTDFHQTIGTPSSMETFLPVEEDETRKFVNRILREPDDLFSHVRRTAGSIVLRIAYGYPGQKTNDPLVKLADDVLTYFSEGTAPGSYWVNAIPALRFLPEWFPGGRFKATAKVWRESTFQLAEIPIKFVKDKMAEGKAETSFTSRLLSENMDLTSEQEEDIKWSSNAMYGGGADTTVATINSFFLAMLLFPEVMKKAQEELDSVVGRDRLPLFLDRDNLPYTNALALEALRWHTVAPTGIPHAVLNDDIHEGYFIPGGSIVIPNIWKMLHDERVYHDPFRFNPERFLGLNPEPDPTGVCFGFGRRICPGRILADASVFIACAMTLACCNIDKYKENGKVVEPVHDQSTGTVSHPIPFKCVITPRSSKVFDILGLDD
ncbi:hypothetical protein CVT24_005869 [Panaeolus cyanescens]|uniref:Cytochrome P450 n=1 Tax=Panaeolus cyanescens TaxID=181874 RepID=A0A409YF02_9AGAR|nr:hypothetical protein CVT24_005869 [Panaeolus cyanescens]